MQAVEFSSIVENDTIRIPERYADRGWTDVRVILLTNEVYPKAEKRFSAMRLKTKGFKFNCDEANER